MKKEKTYPSLIPGNDQQSLLPELGGTKIVIYQLNKAFTVAHVSWRMHVQVGTSLDVRKIWKVTRG